MASLAQSRRDRTGPAGAESLASPQIRALARRRLVELGGLVLGLAGVTLLVALTSYNPRDPSLNTATSVHATNLVGPAGAVLADLLLQGFGLAGLLPGVAMLAWAWSIATRGPAPQSGRAGMRIAATLAALPVLGAALGTLPAQGQGPGLAWPTSAGPGGAAGRVLGLDLLERARDAFGPLGEGVVWVVTLAAALTLVLAGLGIAPTEWRAAARGVWRAVAGVAHGGFVAWERGAAGFRFAAALPEAAASLALRTLDRPPHPSGPARPGPARASGRPSLAALLPREPMADEADGAAAGAAGMPGSGKPGLDVAGSGAAGSGAAIWGSAWGGAADDARDDVQPAPGGERGRDALPAIPRPPSDPRVDAARGDAVTPGDTQGSAAEPAAAPAAVPVAPTMRGRVAGALRVIAPRPAAPSIAPRDEPAPVEGGWRFPPLSLLKPPPERGGTGPSDDALQVNARLLETVLSDYGVQGAIREIRPGPVVTLYELEPAPGIRSARVIGLADDIARSLSVTAVRIATVPGRNVIGIEVPNSFRETVFLSELIGAAEWTRHPSRLALALGKDIAGLPIVADLARMPHLLVAGTTGSGKSVGINAMILSLLFRLSPEQCRMILIDPKMLELSVYDGIPHLMAPVVTEPAKAVTALKWTVREMERRYRAMSQLGVRNVGGYNDRVSEAAAKGEIVTRRVQTGFDSETGRPVFEEQALALETLPFLVVVIDEMADLMMTAGKEIEAAIQRLAQMARAAGIHVIMATQRPSVDVITGTIKANFPTRISYQVISKFDSRTILGEQGAEQLLGQGDLLYMQGGGRIGRVHGPFVGDREVEDVVAFLRAQGEPAYLDEVTDGEADDDGANAALSGIAAAGDGEKGLFDQAVDIVSREGKASTSFLQRHLAIGYNRAAKLIEQMEKEGIITPANHVGRREVLTRRSDD